MTTIDHPLLEAERAIESGFLEPGALERARLEWEAGPRTAARLRESVFEILGPGFRGCLPVAIEEVLDPETVMDGLEVPDRWAATGFIDDGSVLKLAGGTWFGLDQPPIDQDDRRMVLFFLASDEEARDLRALLDQHREPVWAIPATNCFDLGNEREFRTFMEAE